MDVGEEGRQPTLAEAMLGIAALAWQEEAGEFTLESAGDWGRFEGELVVRALDDGRRLELLQDYGFVRPDGSRWPAPAGIIVDGASIPQAFWSLVGGPFSGRYRNASVVHDHYCDTRTRPWRETHRVFLEGMRAMGVPAAKAKVMFYAVQRFGPRWPEPGEAALEALAEDMMAPTKADAATLLADAEAIFVHDLDPDEIERLADARRAEAEEEGAAWAEAGPERAGRRVLDPAARARALVVCGGSGDRADLEAVAAEAALLPVPVIAHFERQRIRIIACRDSITDFERSLRGVVPRGWEATGKTWDVVPGTYFDGKKRVVIATVAAGGATRRVPDRASGRHGSEHLVVHESLHGYDYSRRHAVLADAGFLAARQADLARLHGAMDGYLVQPGQPGLEETWAETGARFLADGTAMAADWPNLHGFWQGWLAGGRAEAAIAEGHFEAPEAGGPEVPIGSATRLADGSVRLDLRAEGPGGAIGHASFTLSPDDFGHAEVVAEAFGDEAAMEAAGEVSRPWYARTMAPKDPDGAVEE